MKKILFSMILAAAAMNINAQLVVDSLGRVGIGTDVPKSMLTVGTAAADTLSAIHCQPYRKPYGIHLKNYYNTNLPITGIYSDVYNNTGHIIGITAQATGIDIPGMYQRAVGLSGYVGYAHTCIGVYGGKCPGTDSSVDFAGVYGADRDYSSFADFPGKYAGYFFGQVRVTHGIYATVLSPVSSPSSSGQSGTHILSDRGESVTDKLSCVQALQFLRDEPKDPKEEEPKPYLSPIQYGLDATQLKAVYPELVYEDANGNVSINYVEMVPLLVQSINELKSELAELKGTASKKAKTQPTTIEETVSDVDMVRMDQNNPNPFSESTVIALNIPEQTQTAKIFIYDMSGKQVQDIAVSERGKTNITVYASDLTAGMYIYTLVVDGKVAVTRRMIVLI